MKKQVDLKALVSHVIRGDGAKKCRICMGDTSEGQVHLSDTVITEGDKPVTLSELLEVVTGVQVTLDVDLPAGLCMECYTCATNAANFRSLCKEMSSKWNDILKLLYNLPIQCSQRDKAMFVVINNDQITIVFDEDSSEIDTSSERLDTCIPTIMDLDLGMDINKDNEVMNDIENGDTEVEEMKICNSELNNDTKTEHKDVNNVLETRKRVKRKNYKSKVEPATFNEKRNESNQNKKPVHPPQCSNCNKKFHHPLHLYYHLKGSTDMIRACHICNKIMTRDDLVAHVSDAHKINIYDCKKCPETFITKKKYIQHLNKAHSHGVCLCVDCGQMFKSHNAFHAHISVHRRKACPYCDKIFYNNTCYKYHIKNCNLKENRDFEVTKTKEEDIKTINNNQNSNIKVKHGSTDDICVCDYCGKQFAKKKYVTAHIQIIHMKTTHMPCIYCGKLLASAHMMEHLRSHELNLSFKCQHCGVVLKSKLGYVQHLRLHTGERPYTCKICKESFSASSRRSEHMRRVHKGPNVGLYHACKLCSAKFRLPYRLKRHVLSAHIDETDESQLFQCFECKEKFGSHRGLLHHSRKHQKVDFPFRRPEKTMVLKLSNEPEIIKKK